MIGIVLAAAAVGAVASPLAPGAVEGKLEVIPSATAEVQAGEAPVTYGAAPKPMTIESVTPGVALGFLGRRLELLAGYQLRIYWKNVSGDLAPSPLLLNMANLMMTAKPTRRLVLKLSGTATEGHTDYTYLSNVLGTGTATSSPEIFAANLTGSADLHVTELATIGIALQAVRSQPIGQTTTTTTTTPPPTGMNVPTTVLPYFTSFAATPGVAVRISHTDDLSSAVGVQYQHVADVSLTDPSGTAHPGSVVTAFIVSPGVGFHRIVSPHSEFTLHAGLAVTHVRDVLGTSDSVSPVGGAALDFRLMNTRRAILQLRFSESLEYYLDPVLATAADHSYTTAALNLGLPKNWTIALEGSFITPLSSHPLLTASTTPGAPPTLTYFDEVAASAQLSARHLLSNYLLLEFGGQWGNRAPFFTAPHPYDYGFHQRQLFLFVMLTATTHPTWLLPREVASLQ
jgi:hypothetical protein